MVNNGEVESFPKRTHHLPTDHYGKVGRALCPYLPGLGVQVRQRLMGFRPRSPVVNGLHVHVIRPSSWPAPLA